MLAIENPKEYRKVANMTARWPPLLLLALVLCVCRVRGGGGTLHTCAAVVVEGLSTEKGIGNINPDPYAAPLIAGSVGFSSQCLRLVVRLEGYNEKWRGSAVQTLIKGMGVSSCLVDVDALQGASRELGGCFIDAISLPPDGKLMAFVGLLTPTLVRADIKDINLKTSRMIANATFSFSVHQIEDFRPQKPVPKAQGQCVGAPQPCTFAPKDVESIHSTVDCDASQSCRLQNVLFSGLSNGSTFFTFENEGETVACFSESISTTVHRRFVRHMGKYDPEKIVANLKMRKGSQRERNFLRRMVSSGEKLCDHRNVFAFNIPKPTYYYHAMTEGAIPLAHTVLNRAIHPSTVTLLPLQTFSRDAIPKFTQESIQALSHNAIDTAGLSAGPRFYRDITIGFYPTLRTKAELAKSVDFLATSIVRADAASKRRYTHLFSSVPATPPSKFKLVIAQRSAVQNENFPGQSRKLPTRRFLNINEIVRSAQALGYKVTVVAFEGMSLREQVQLLESADVYLSTFGSQWTNAAFQKPGKVSILVYPWGLKHGCRHQIAPYKPVQILADRCHRSRASGSLFGKNGFIRRKTDSAYFYDDHCDGALEAFPNLARGTYYDIEVDAEETIPAFNFSAQYCDQETVLEAFGGDVQACVKREEEVQRRALLDPDTLWDEDWVKAHYFFLNQNFRIRVDRLEQTLRRALSMLRINGQGKVFL